MIVAHFGQAYDPTGAGPFYGIKPIKMPVCDVGEIERLGAARDVKPSVIGEAV